MSPLIALGGVACGDDWRQFVGHANGPLHVGRSGIDTDAALFRLGRTWSVANSSASLDYQPPASVKLGEGGRHVANQRC